MSVAKTIFYRYKMHHGLIWLTVFAVWFYLRHQDYAATATAVKVTLIKVVDLALMIYLTNYLLIPQLLYRKKYLLFAFIFVVLIVTGSILKMNVLGKVLNNPQGYSFSGNVKARFYDNMLPHFFLVLAGTAIKLGIDYGVLQQRLSLAARGKATAELNFLKSQINPHFLFNSINAIYFLIDKENATARNALHQFADLFRYQLYEMNDDTIPIEKEIQFLRDYISLQQLRTDEELQISYTPDASASNFNIEPLLLIPFVENAFKHVSASATQQSFVGVRFYCTNGVFHCKVENTVGDTEVATSPHRGIGLVNVTRRLQLLYPGRHQLHYGRDQQVFRVALSIQLYPAT